ncbi:hypothetical protein OROMI_021879 [Orobanche minor]
MLGMICSISWYCITKHSYDDCDSTYQRGDLHEYLKRKGALKRATGLRFAMDIARGMNYLHENKPEAIIHCNLEPYRNILRDDYGHLNVADFGVSKLLKVENRVKEDRPLTCHDTSCRYVAPEVFRNEEYDTQVDVFSFALILQEVVFLYDEVSLQNVSDVTAEWTMKQRQMLRNKLWLGGFSRYLGEANYYVAEIWAVWEGLKMARGLGFSKIELQVDSKAVMASISNHMADSFDDRGLFLRLSCFNGL